MKQAPLSPNVTAPPLANIETFVRYGKVVDAFGGMIRATGLVARIGQSCEVVDPAGGEAIPAEVVGIKEGAVVLTPLRPLRGLRADATIRLTEADATVMLGDGLVGRVIGADLVPLDGCGPIGGILEPQPLYADAPGPLERSADHQVFPTGVRAIDALLTAGAGQRVGLFATAGAGKSTLLGMIARGATSDINVIALIGERGREVRDFIEFALGAGGLTRSIVVVATSDRSAAERVRAAHVATAIAEFYRTRGRRVLLMMDSVTRFARALRELGLAMGEPAVRRGYPPSVFGELPRLFERAGSVGAGSITAFYTVLLEDDEADPIGEEARATLDGHIVLSRALADAGRFPAIDVLASVSRYFGLVSGAEQRAQAERIRAWVAKYAEIEFLLQVGEHHPGADPAADEAISRAPMIQRLLRQAPDDTCSLDDCLSALRLACD